MSGVLLALMHSSGATIQIADVTVGLPAVTPSNAEAGYSLESDGDITTYVNLTPSDAGDWIVPKAAAGSSWEVRATIVGGTVTSGTTGSWLSLGSTRTWTKQRTSDIPGTDTVVLTIEIRNTATGVVKDTATVTLNATVES